MTRLASWVREALVGERYRAARENARRTFMELVRRPIGAAGLGIILLFIALALLAPVLGGEYPNYGTGANLCAVNLPPGVSGFRPVPREDTSISSVNETPRGNASTLSVSRWGVDANYSLLAFSIGDRVCKSMVIHGATLRLRVAGAAGTDFPTTLFVGRNVADFTEADANWTSTYPLVLDAYAQQELTTAPAPGTEIRMDITHLVRRWHEEQARTRFSIALWIDPVSDDTTLDLTSSESTALAKPSLELSIEPIGFPLGTDTFGRSIFTLLLYGAQVSLIVGFTASLIAMVVGAGVGILSGYYGGTWDHALSRLTDFFLVIPWLPFVLVLVAVLGPGFITIVIAIAVVSWPTTARVVRSKVLSVKTLAYVERARAIGAQDRHIMVRHIFPVVGPLIFANMILTVSNSIWTESFLAFFGLGDQERVSWGTMIENAYSGATIFTGAYWYFLPPGICITAVVLAFTMVSYALEEILNPKLRKR